MNLEAKKNQEDNARVLESIEKLAGQCAETWKTASGFYFPKTDKLKNIVVAGMGGSSLGSHIVRSVFGDKFKLPFVLVNGYELPEFVNAETFLILSSYSGNTEEVLSCLRGVKARNAGIVILTGGGFLANYAKKNNLPLFEFSAEFNPSGTPRMGIGYSIFGILGILKKAGIIKISDNEIEGAIKTLEKSFIQKNNEAQKIAGKLKGKIPVLVGSEFLIGNIHAFQNQLHETAKYFSAYFELPELNHHLMEGLKNPADKKIIFVLIESGLYHPRNRKRMELTKEVIRKNKTPFMEIELSGKDKFLQSLECLVLTSLISYYLGLKNKENLVKTEWVDYFKKRLGK